MVEQDPPPAYALHEFTYTKTPEANTTDQETGPVKVPWYNPRSWPPGTRVRLPLLIIIILVITVVPIEVIKNRYPNYKYLEYKLVDEYSGPKFFEKFNYFTEEDPTKGFVVYVNGTTATNLNLTHASDTAILRVDAATRNAKDGRNSVRIESKKTYDEGLFIFDILHTPFGCGTWPALWLTDGYNWPSNGEIDVLETTNGGSQGNEITLHTTKGCSMNVKRKQTGQVLANKCDDTQHGNAGCGILGNSSSYGEVMNNNGGGIYALEIRTEGIRVWYFRRDSIPADIGTKPDPTRWGIALADFPSTKCNVGSHFRNQSIIANIDLCGELAAQAQYYDTMYHCPATCPEFVAMNPGSFVDAFWEFKSFKVYQSSVKLARDARLEREREERARKEEERKKKQEERKKKQEEWKKQQEEKRKQQEERKKHEAEERRKQQEEEAKSQANAGENTVYYASNPGILTQIWCIFFC
ncbi:unnamed protein product [Penicillium olsonii]|nr:unnamed protein product [Penicillium olsonii]